MINQKQRNREGRKSAVFPLPEFHSLCCPRCDKYKMKLRTDLNAFQCLGPECQYLMSWLEAENYIGMEMVEG